MKIAGWDLSLKKIEKIPLPAEIEKTYIVSLTRDAIIADPITIKATSIKHTDGFFTFKHGEEIVCIINEKLIEKILLTELEGQ